MSFLTNLKIFILKHFFNAKWCCNGCGKEIFNEGYFCDECEKSLPYNDEYICDHCGRKLIQPSAYCNTCKEFLVNIDKARSVFVYDKPISYLIQGAKYEGKKYLLDLFAEKLTPLYFKNYFNADFICYVPMSDNAFKKRGYNQSEILARKLSEKIKIPVVDCVKKIKETDRQAKLNRKDRLKNLSSAFKVVSKKLLKDKAILIVDDVSTTGATAEVIASALKKGGASKVYLLTVASVPSKDGY